MTVLITGGRGFLAWHTACRFRALHDVEPVRLGREEMKDPATVREALANVDSVLHLAGVNRAESDEAVRLGNAEAATQLADGISSLGRPLHVVYANSIQADLDNPYGTGKAEAALILNDAARQAGGTFVDVLLPNLFGEHGRPAYNSFVATFCHLLASGGAPTVTGDKEVPLLHAQRAANILIAALSDRTDGQLRPAGEVQLVSEVLSRLELIHATYSLGEVPALADDFAVDLFNTYRSYTFPDMFPVHPPTHADARGVLVEAARTHGGTGHVFVSTTEPGATRGDHYHLHKVERFFVVKGTAEIRLRRLLHDDIVTFGIDGSRPGFVDMPTMWVHNITNVGDDELVTVFWADQLLNPEQADQYAERVVSEVTV